MKLILLYILIVVNLFAIESSSGLLDKPSVTHYEPQDFALVGTKGDTTYSIGYESGIRQDEFRWNKGQANYVHTDNNTYRPNILSELVWENMTSVYHRFFVEVRKNRYILKGKYGFGKSYEGDNQDSDYLYDDRNGEFSRSNNSADDSYFRDYEMSIGRLYSITDIADLIFSAGYSNNLQKLKIKSGYQTIPNTGAFAGLNSQHKSTWKGPFIAGDLELFKNDDLSFDMGLQYHMFDYEGVGTWNLRNELAQPTSFTQDGSGRGYMMHSSMKYKIQDNVNFLLKYQKSEYKVKDGQDTIFFANGLSGKSILNEAISKTNHLLFGVEYKF